MTRKGGEEEERREEEIVRPNNRVLLSLRIPLCCGVTLMPPQIHATSRCNAETRKRGTRDNSILRFS